MTLKLAALADRRADNRLATPLCLHCADGQSMVGIIRTTRFVYFRCPHCGDLQPKLMPALESSSPAQPIQGGIMVG